MIQLVPILNKQTNGLFWPRGVGQLAQLSIRNSPGVILSGLAYKKTQLITIDPPLASIPMFLFYVAWKIGRRFNLSNLQTKHYIISPFPPIHPSFRIKFNSLFLLKSSF